MNPTIRVLPDEVANHIAAGEVIERPASVVKELVENALDAGATQIDLEIGVGGKAYLRVKDNGHGMSRENAQLAFERHATSKIHSTADIAKILTLGFRGEALPSIASVAKMRLITQTADDLVGTRLEIHGGELLSVADCVTTPGTAIDVNELFYKTPVRLKFLKAPATEVGYINNVVLDQALGHPQVGFTVKNNGREQLHLPAQGSLLQRIAGMFGRELVREVVEMRYTAGSLELSGFIGLPSCHRTNRNHQKMFVNQRPVKDKTISHAIQQAYDTLIPKKRYPVAFLFLTLPVELVDVNVHPAKSEIRFINSQAIHDLVVKGIRQTLNAALYSADSPARPLISTAVNFPATLDDDDLPFQDGTAGEARDFPATSPTFTGASAPTLPRPRFTTPSPGLDSQGMLLASFQPGATKFARMTPLGQFQETYILAQAGDDLFILDQHAAHERVFYEKLRRQFASQTLEIQPLLFPVALELSHREQAALEAHLDNLRAYGLEVEPFGGTTYLLKAVPALLTKADYKKMVYDILDQLTDTEEAANMQQTLDDVLKVMACHAAIRAHHHLQDAQITALLQQMDDLDLPYSCPHGRPTVLKISLADLEKKFGRTGN